MKKKHVGILASCPYNESNNTKILTSNKTRFRSINNENKEEHQSKEKGNQRIDMCAYTKKAVYVRDTDDQRKSSAIYTLQHICPESNLKLSINRVFFLLTFDFKQNTNLFKRTNSKLV